MNGRIFQILFVLTLIFSSESYQEKATYKVGAIFKDETQETAFRAIISEMNGIYPFIISPIVHVIPSEDPLETYHRTCELMSHGIIGLFGPSSTHSSNYIHSICDSKEIPHIEINYDPDITRSSLVNVHPNPKALSFMFLDLLTLLEWRNIFIMYDDEELLSTITPILELNNNGDKPVIMTKLEKDDEDSFRTALIEIKYSGQKLFVVSVSPDSLEEILRELQQVGMMTDGYSYIITNLNLDTLDLTSYQYGAANITGIRMVNPTKPIVIDAQSLIQKAFKSSTWKIDLNTALLFDAVQLFYDALDEFLVENRLEVYPIDCNRNQYWNHGYSLVNAIKTKVINGLTGTTTFNVEGLRTDFIIEVLELSYGGLIKIGDWNSTSRKVVIYPHEHKRPKFKTYTPVNLFNRTFIVIMSQTPPYGMLKETTTQLTGNDRYEGFGIDVIEELSKILGFNYTFVEQEDNNYGSLDKNTNEWNGMIREILDGRADLAITDLTITSERENAVDFTMPFMSLGISILYRKPEPVPPSLFMFMSPFSSKVWIMLCVAYFVMSFSFVLMSRLSPQEWQNVYPCVEEPEHLENQFTIRNSMWFTLGALLQQGSEIAPVALSTRTAAGAWGLFVLIMCASYTANLAAFLTVETLVTPFNDIEELANQNEIKYGAKDKGSTANFFRDSNVTIYQRVHQYMKKHHDEVMLHDNDLGVEKVKNENYAFLMESTSIEYATERHCSLSAVGEHLDEKGYGIAMKKNSEYRGELSEAVLQLQERGVLSKLQMKWWKEKRGGGKCTTKNEQTAPQSLDLQHLGGVFLILVLGTFIGVLGSLTEITYKIYKKSKAENLSFKHEIRKEVMFFLKFKERVRELGQESSSGSNSETNKEGSNKFC